MNYELAGKRYPLPPSAYVGYLRRDVQPSLDPNKLAINLMWGDQRQHLIKTPTTGDATMAVYYKTKEGAVSSFKTEGTAVWVLQLQGAKSSESYRVTTGLHWTDLFADELVTLASHPESGVDRIAMLNPLLIEGVVQARSEATLIRYQNFITHAYLRWSQDERAFFRDLNHNL